MRECFIHERLPCSLRPNVKRRWILQLRDHGSCLANVLALSTQILLHCQGHSIPWPVEIRSSPGNMKVAIIQDGTGWLRVTGLESTGQNKSGIYPYYRILRHEPVLSMLTKN